MLNFYSTYKFLSNFLSNWHELDVLTDFFSYTFINRSIDILPEFWRFCQGSEHCFSNMFASRAFYSVIWSQHSNVQVSIFVTCLNFAGTGSRLWQLYVVFVLTWYLAFKTSGRTASAVRPVILGKLTVEGYSILEWLKEKRCPHSD